MQLPFGIPASKVFRYAIGALILIAIGVYIFVARGKNLGATLIISPADFKEQVSVSGTVIAAQNVGLGFSANGRIAGIYAKVGQHIDTGAIIAETENGDLVAAIAQKQAAFAVAEANLESLKKGTRSEEIAVASTAVASAISALATAVQSAYTTCDDAVHNRADSFFTNPRTDSKLSFTVANSALKLSVERDRSSMENVLANWANLVAKISNENTADSAKQSQNYISQVISLLAEANNAVNQGLPDQTTSVSTISSYGTTLATARTNVNTAATTLASSVANLESAQKNLALKRAGSTNESITAQESIVASAVADVQNARAALAKTRIVAPFGGTVTRMDAKVGEVVSPTASLIAMQSAGIFEIETYVPEVSISRIVSGNPATTTLDAYGPSIVFSAKVLAVDPAETIKDGVPTYKVTLAFLSEDLRIRSGMTANVVIETGVLHNAIVIPSGAIGAKNGIQFVSVVDRGSITPRTVTTGVSPSLGQAYVLSGLSKGDVILLAPR